MRGGGAVVIVAWLVIGVILLLFESRHLAFYALFGAAGAFAAAIVAGFAPDEIFLQAIVGGAVTAVGIMAVRPRISRAFEQHRGGRVARGVHGGLVGEEALTLDAIGGAHEVGHVRLAGERWLAYTEGKRLPAGTRVLVMAVRGTTLLVWPADDDELPQLPELGNSHGAPGAVEPPAPPRNQSENNGAPGATDGG
jgi:membrane protein implicated in regulation of membrane protease activity